MGQHPTAVAVVAIVGAGVAVAKARWLTQAIGGVVLITAAGMLAAPHLVLVAWSRRTAPSAGSRRR